MRLKKFSALLCVFLLLSLCACGSTGKNAPPSAMDAAPELTADLLIFDWVEDPAEAAEDAGASDSPAPAEINLSETVLFDGQNVKITATGIRSGGWAGPELLLAFENNTDQDLAFTCEDLYINGCKTGRGLYTEVAAGGKADDSMAIYDVDLAAYGIDVIAEITLSFHVSDAQWDVYCLTDLITVRTDAAETYDFTYESGGEVLYEGKGFRIVSLGRADEDSYWGPATLLYFENNTKRTVTFQTRDASTGGHRLDAVLSTTLRPGMRAIDDLSVDKGELAQYGIGEIGTLALRFMVFDDETGDELLATNEIEFAF